MVMKHLTKKEGKGKLRFFRVVLVYMGFGSPFIGEGVLAKDGPALTVES